MSELSKSKPAAAPTVAELHAFFDRQLAHWPMARANYDALGAVTLRRAGRWEVQFNPARARSAKAVVDKAAVAARPCFLCRANRPAEQHIYDWRGYEILVNPFPIFGRHFTVASLRHEPQGLAGRVGDMADLALSLPGHVVFYNGAHCGASAPDHMHLQIALWPEAQALLETPSPHRLVVRFADVAEAEAYIAGNDDVNVLALSDGGKLRIYVVPRRAHRPSDYDKTLISPGSVDVAGRIITVLPEVGRDLTESDIDRIYSEVCYTDTEE